MAKLTNQDLTKIIAKGGEFYCRYCNRYRSLAGAKPKPGKSQLRCAACLAKIRAPSN